MYLIGYLCLDDGAVMDSIGSESSSENKQGDDQHQLNIIADNNDYISASEYYALAA